MTKIFALLVVSASFFFFDHNLQLAEARSQVCIGFKCKEKKRERSSGAKEKKREKRKKERRKEKRKEKNRCVQIIRNARGKCSALQKQGKFPVTKTQNCINALKKRHGC